MFPALIMGHFAWLWVARDHLKKREFKLFCAGFCNISIYHLVLSFTRSILMMMMMMMMAVTILVFRMMMTPMMTIYIFSRDTG